MKTHRGLKIAWWRMWKVRCKVSDSVCALCVHVTHVHTACMLPRGSDMFECVRLRSIFGCRPGGWTWGSGCLAGWRSDMMQCRVSECRWPLLLLRPGYYSGTLTGVVSPTCRACFAFIYQTGESKKQFKRSRRQWKAQFGWIELLWHSGCEYFFHIWQDDSVFFCNDSFPFSSVKPQYITPCISMSMWKLKLLGFTFKSEPLLRLQSQVSKLTWLCDRLSVILVFTYCFSAEVEH